MAPGGGQDRSGERRLLRGSSLSRGDEAYSEPAAVVFQLLLPLAHGFGRIRRSRLGQAPSPLQSAPHQGVARGELSPLGQLSGVPDQGAGDLAFSAGLTHRRKPPSGDRTVNDSLAAFRPVVALQGGAGVHPVFLAYQAGTVTHRAKVVLEVGQRKREELDPPPKLGIIRTQIRQFST